MNKCFICNNIGTVRNSSGWHDKEKKIPELVEVIMEYPSQGNWVKMKILKCAECMKFSEELTKMEDISIEVPPLIEEIIETKELPEKQKKETNLERE